MDLIWHGLQPTNRMDISQRISLEPATLFPNLLCADQLYEKFDLDSFIGNNLIW